MKNTIQFLKQLDKNNNREWFQANKQLYEQSHEEMLDFASNLIGEMNKTDNIETTAKRSLFRIYRDVRFAKDKTPYKTNWAGTLKRASAELRGGYYYQIGFNGAFIMGGFFGPNAKDMLHIRKQLALDAEPLRKIISNRQLQLFFGGLQGEQLKTAPQGFDRDHEAIDLLRYKQLLLRHDYTKEEILSQNFHKKLAEGFRKMRPFFDYMSDILTSDLNGVRLI